MRDIDEVSGIIVNAAYSLHSRLGPGLLESVYTRVLGTMLEHRGLAVEREKAVTFEFDGLLFEGGLRVDLLVEQQVVVEVKSMEALAPVHGKQILTYLRLLDLRVGLLINFGALRLNDGLRRVVNRHSPSPNTPLRIDRRLTS